MSHVFDLSRLRNLINSRHPKAVVVVDTNVVIREPDFSKWVIPVGETLFILSDMIIRELEHLKKRPDSREKAISAVNSLNGLLSQGAISEGIKVEKVGWFISPPSPPTENARAALTQFQDIVNAFKESDTLLLILAIELIQMLPDMPVIFVTGDKNLFNIVETNSVPSCLFEGFPLEKFQMAVNKSLNQKLDWDRILGEIQETTVERSLPVEITLLGKTMLPNSVQDATSSSKQTRRALAEGRGVVHRRTESIPFLWSLYFTMYDLDSISEELVNSEKHTVSIDFLGSDAQIPDSIARDLKAKIQGCADWDAWVSGMPTVQNLSFLMQDEMCDWRDKEQVDALKAESNEAGSVFGVWCKKVLSYISEGEEIDERMIASYWNIGETRKFTILEEPQSPEWLRNLVS